MGGAANGVKVSVVVPLFNKAPYVTRTLASLRAQTFRAFEVIVVDDGSTDGSAAWAERFGDPRVRVIRQANAGPGAARNRGAAEASGKFLAFLDADDEWDPLFLERTLAWFDASGPEVAAVTAGHRALPNPARRARTWDRRGIEDGVFRLRPHGDAIGAIHRLAYVSPCSTLIRRGAFERHGGFFARDKCSFGEDAFFFLKLLLHDGVLLRREELVTFHEDASALSQRLRPERPIEPFLQYPEEVLVDCPSELRSLLRRILAIRAAKTASVLAFWGRVDEARALLERFELDRDRKATWDRVASVMVHPKAGRAVALMQRAWVAWKRRGVAAVPAAAGRSTALQLPPLPAGLPDPTLIPPIGEVASPKVAGVAAKGSAPGDRAPAPPEG